MHSHFFIPSGGLVIRHFCTQYMAVVNYPRHFVGECTMLLTTVLLCLSVTVRFCAVFGGVYVLRRSIASVLLDENKSVLLFPV